MSEHSVNEEERKETDEKKCSYQATINVLNILRRQLAQANKDVELLQELKKDALERPYEFLSELKSKVFKQL